MIFVNLDGQLAGHVAVALARHTQQLRREGIPAPDGLDGLLDAVTSCVKKRHDATSLDDITSVTEHQPMAPLLLTKDDAARVLGMSKRSVERLIADGHLPSVHLGGSARIRRSDLEDYVAALQPSQSVPAR